MTLSSTPQHHPGAETLAAYAAGQLPPGAALVIAAHLGFCRECRALARGFEALGGALLEAEPMADVPSDLFDRTMARLEGPAPAAVAVALPGQVGIDLPPALQGVGVGPWRWSGPGLRIAKLDVPVVAGSRVMLMRIAAGQAMPRHGHSGSELTLVLAGAYTDATGRFGPGDLSDEDEDSDHQPVVEAGADCFCLVAVSGKLKLTGIARLVQPFLGL